MIWPAVPKILHTTIVLYFSSRFHRESLEWKLQLFGMKTLDQTEMHMGHFSGDSHADQEHAVVFQLYYRM